MQYPGIKELLEAGVHFGHQTRRWNPKMKPYIFEARNGIHIIDLSQTVTQIEAACRFLEDTARQGGEILFVGTKKQAQVAVKEAATASGAMYVIERWLGGTLTNFSTLKKSLERLRHIEKMEADGSILNYVKQEQSMLRREAGRMCKNLDGIRLMAQKMPSALLIVDLKREHNAVAEARRLKIPIVGVVDTNCDPDQADYPVAANDDAIRSVRLILNTLTQAIARGRAEFEAKYARRKTLDSTEAAAPAATPPQPDTPAAPEATPPPAESASSLPSPVAAPVAEQPASPAVA
ncbi:MAG: 30S ribosomal protein S2 [Verrucomicrobiae bacterium]|nr:30S ribosomal protein S2 [Verrucomicrobiae bacterium]